MRGRRDTLTSPSPTVVAVAVAVAVAAPSAHADVSFVPTREGALAIWSRSDGEVVVQALDESFAPRGEMRTAAPAEQRLPLAPVAPAVATRGEGAWILLEGDPTARAVRLDAAGNLVGAPWNLDVHLGSRSSVAGNEGTLYAAVEAPGEVRLARFSEPGPPEAEATLPLPRAHRLLGIVLRAGELYVAAVGESGRGFALAIVTEDLEGDGAWRRVPVGVAGARWSPLTTYARGVAAVAAAGPAPVAVLYTPGDGFRVVELAHSRSVVLASLLAPWAGAGVAGWLARADPPAAAVRRLGPSLSPEEPPYCAVGFPGASLAGLVAGRPGAMVGWFARTEASVARIAVTRPNRSLGWIAGEHVAELTAAGRIELPPDGVVPLPGRRPITLPEVTSRPGSIALATRRGTSIVAYTAVIDGRARVRVVRVHRGGRATPPRTISSAARVEIPVSVEATSTGFAVRWLEERGRDVVVSESRVL